MGGGFGWGDSLSGSNTSASGDAIVGAVGASGLDQGSYGSTDNASVSGATSPGSSGSVSGTISASGSSGASSANGPNKVTGSSGSTGNVAGNYASNFFSLLVPLPGAAPVPQTTKGTKGSKNTGGDGALPATLTTAYFSNSSTNQSTVVDGTTFGNTSFSGNGTALVFGLGTFNGSGVANASAAGLNSTADGSSTADVTNLLGYGNISAGPMTGNGTASSFGIGNVSLGAGGEANAVVAGIWN